MITSKSHKRQTTTTTVLFADLVASLNDFCLISFIELSLWCYVDAVISSSSIIFASLMMLFMSYESVLAGQRAVLALKELSLHESRARFIVYLIISLVVVVTIFLGVNFLTPGFGSPNSAPNYCHLVDPEPLVEILAFWGWVWISVLGCLLANVYLIALLLRHRSKTTLPSSKINGTKYSWCLTAMFASFTICFFIIFLDSFLIHPADLLSSGAIFRLALYPAIFAASAFPSSLYRIITFSDPFFPNYVSIVGQFTLSLLGFFDAMVLGSNRLVRREWRSMFCCKKRSNAPRLFLIEDEEESPQIDSLMSSDLTDMRGSLSFIP